MWCNLLLIFQRDQIVHQLLGCLDSDLITLVYNENNSPEELDESTLLKLIEKVSVKPENIWVTREKLHSMAQDPGEAIASFACMQIQILMFAMCDQP